MDIKYTIRTIADGLGGQVKTLSELLRFADRFDLSVLCDLRTFPFFWESDSKHYSDEEASRLLEFHPRIIYDSKEIDSIKKLDGSGRNEVLDWEHWWPLHKTRVLAGFGLLPMRLRDRTQFKSLLPRVKNSTVVHARLGNGERKFLDEEAPPRSGPDHAKRMSTPKSLFIAEMKKHSGDFFVCSDDGGFFNECKKLFGDRVFCSGRTWLPYGSGPGHNVFEEYEKACSINPWVRLGDALLDMELLCEGKHLICNKSQLSLPARKKLKSTMLA